METCSLNAFYKVEFRHWDSPLSPLAGWRGRGEDQYGKEDIPTARLAAYCNLGDGHESGYAHQLPSDRPFRISRKLLGEQLPVLLQLDLEVVEPWLFLDNEPACSWRAEKPLPSWFLGPNIPLFCGDGDGWLSSRVSDPAPGTIQYLRDNMLASLPLSAIHGHFSLSSRFL